MGGGASGFKPVVSQHCANENEQAFIRLRKLITLCVRMAD